ncbi:hypothetical protein PHMEG_00017358, partial [Phytophthora megakarya]
GVKTKSMDKCRIKITLGHRAVYTLDVWVGNIGRGIDVLLGMNLMVVAGVRLCAHKGEVVLPDEERILLIVSPKRAHVGRTVDVSIHESLWLAPGDSKYIPIRTSEPDLGSMDTWVSQGDRWVTRIIFSPGSYQYDKREFLVYENTRCPATECRLDADARVSEQAALPMVDRPEYPIPTRVLQRDPRASAAVLEVLAAHRDMQTPDHAGSGQPTQVTSAAQHETSSRPGDYPAATALAPGAGHVMAASDETPEPDRPRPQASGWDV